MKQKGNQVNRSNKINSCYRVSRTRLIRVFAEGVSQNLIADGTKINNTGVKEILSHTKHKQWNQCKVWISQ
jgi:DNA invertase Pin-like site-specific DNA recombinase